MPEKKLLLCTDMDRTIIPNGTQPEHPHARKWFAEFCRQPGVELVYVTGRHLKLVQEAIRQFNLPVPDYAITDVGTKIYSTEENAWKEFLPWEREIGRAWNGKTHTQLKSLFATISPLQLQEAEKQNKYKLSYYVPLHINSNELMNTMQMLLGVNDINASLVWSVDELKGLGLLDVLPANATKLHAIKFLHQQLGYLSNAVIFAGDSGNDLDVMGSDINSILVANAAPDVIIEAKKRAKLSGNLSSLYVVSNDSAENTLGNYSAGVLKGICHFAPTFCEQLNKLGNLCDK